MLKRALITIAMLTLILSACSAAQVLPRQAEAPPAGPPAPAEFDAAGEPAFAESETFGKTAGLAADNASAADRLVIKNADLNIVVDDPAKSMDEIAALADRLGGFVVSSNLYRTELQSGEEVPRASITIRVPAERLVEALKEIENGATRVLEKNESGQDVTQEYTDLQSRLRNLEDAEAQLRLIMDDARRTEDVLSVFNQLTQVREQIEVIKGQIQYYEQSAAFSAIRIELIANAAVQPLSIGGWEPVGVARESLQSLITALQALVNILIRLALLWLPMALVIGIPLLLIWRGARNWRRRRKASRPLAETPPAES